MKWLAEELEHAGCALSWEEFVQAELEALREFRPGWSDDDLLDTPSDADDFVALVQYRVGNWKLDSEVILGSLTAYRKSYGLPRGMVARKQHPAIARQLDAARCGVQVEEFRDALLMVFEEKLAAVFSTETFRFQPRVSRHYCRLVREVVNCDLPDFLILRALGNFRKSKQLEGAVS